MGSSQSSVSEKAKNRLSNLHLPSRRDFKQTTPPPTIRTHGPSEEHSGSGGSAAAHQRMSDSSSSRGGGESQSLGMRAAADHTNTGRSSRTPSPSRHHQRTPTPTSNSLTPANINNNMSRPNTVPCQYRTGRTLGSGTYAIVKEAVHIKTGKYYACKVINKKLMEGREHMVRNEIAVLKKVSIGHRNIVTLHDYFETTHNLYLIFDLCTGGELFDRICAKGNYYEADAAALIRTIMQAVKYIHDCGIVHRDLKPENLIFRTKAEESDVMIADFGLSRIMEEDRFQLLHEICGTPGYMAPEIFKKVGHSKPVDIWAMGVITYFLLCGYTPFDRDTQKEEMEAICKGDYKFEPAEYWINVSPTAKEFVALCLTIDPTNRPTAAEALQHRWLASEEPHFVSNELGNPVDLLPNVRKGFDAKKTFRKAIISVMAGHRLSTIVNQNQIVNPQHEKLANDIKTYKEHSEKEIIDENLEVQGHDLSDHTPPPSAGVSPKSFQVHPPPSPLTAGGLTEKMKETKLS